MADSGRSSGARPFGEPSISRSDQVVQRLDDIEYRFGSLATRVTRLERSINELEATLGNLWRRVDVTMKARAADIAVLQRESNIGRRLSRREEREVRDEAAGRSGIDKVIIENERETEGRNPRGHPRQEMSRPSLSG